MSNKLDSREVLACLNEFGFTNINAQQLKEFMQDLKTLIKYDQRKHVNGEKTGNCDCMNNKSRKIAENLHSQQTISSRAKNVAKKEVLVEINRPKIRKIDHEHCIHIDDNKSCKCCCFGGAKTVETNGNEKQPEFQKIEIPSKVKKPVKSKSSFIRPRVATSSKSDPIALYQQYQKEWKKRKVPGEDRRNELRWTIRQKMLGENI